MSNEKIRVVEVAGEPDSQPKLDRAGSVSKPWEQPADSTNYSLRSLRAQAEVYAITRALERVGWNRKRAAQLLRISYRALLYKISCHKITRTVGNPGAASSDGSLAPNGAE